MTKDIEREAFEATQNTNVLFERIEYIASMDAYMPKHEFANNLIVMQSAERFNFGWSMWKSATERAEKKLEGCVVVPVESLNKTIDAIEDMFEDDPTLALGELLPIQQDIKAMLEAARGGNDELV